MAVLLSNILKYRDEATSASWSNILISVESSYPTSITGIVKGEGQNGMTAAILGTDYTTINDQLATSSSYTWSVNKIQSTHNNLIQSVTPKIISITLSSSSWTAVSNLNEVYSQNITISGGTSLTKVDLQADAVTLLQMQDDGVLKIYIVNNSGTFTAYAIGAMPTTNLSVQATCNEVIQE